MADTKTKTRYFLYVDDKLVGRSVSKSDIEGRAAYERGRYSDRNRKVRIEVGTYTPKGR